MPKYPDLKSLPCLEHSAMKRLIRNETENEYPTPK